MKPFVLDDNAEALSKRLAAYRAQTEPLVDYYSEQRKLLTIDGMMTIEHVTREINRILAAQAPSKQRLPEKSPKWPPRKAAKAR